MSALSYKRTFPPVRTMSALPCDHGVAELRSSRATSYEEDKMPYALITALIFALVAILHGWRIFKGWTVQIGPHSVSMTVSWTGLVVAALLAIWGFSLSA